MSPLIQNRKVFFNYEVLEKIEAGIELLGNEVKSLRAGQGTLDGTHITIRGGEAYLIGMDIPAYQPKNTSPEYNPKRNRRLLLTKKELAELSGKESSRGLTLVPISVYNKGRNLKIEIAIVRGKKKFDKRESTKKRETEREMRRTLKGE